MDQLEASEIQKLEGFRQRLQDINSTGAYITKLSQEILLSEKTGLAKHYIEVWSNAIINENAPSKIISLFYVINDFIQLSHLRPPELIQTTIPFLKNVCESISKSGKSSSTIEECQRVISIWRARCVFEDRTICLALTKLLQGYDERGIGLDISQVPNDFDEENSNKKKLRLLQSDGENSDGFITASPRLLPQYYSLPQENQSSFAEIPLQLKTIHELRKQLLDKVYFGRKIDLEIDDLLLKHTHISKQQNLSTSALELDDIQKVLKQNRAKQRVLIQKQWKLRQKLHNSFESLFSIISSRTKMLFIMHYEAHKVLFKKKSLTSKSTDFKN